MNTKYADVKQAAFEHFGCEPDTLAEIKGGANNICLALNVAGKRMLAKKYFFHERDKRDRLNAEFSMLRFLWRNRIRYIPEPLALDRERKIGFYEFIEGDKPCSDRIKIADVERLCVMLVDMWGLRNEPGAESLPAGSDAAFSIMDYVDCINTRMDIILRCANSPHAPSVFREFTENSLSPFFGALMKDMKNRLARYGIDPCRVLTERERTLNPADHGFHNAIRRNDGSLVFIDFEYSGWDDPAQMLCNACLQPEIPIPTRHINYFLQVMTDKMGRDETLVRRLNVVYPLLAFKWCLIMLNEFLPVSDERRRFAGAAPEQRREAQVQKAIKQIGKLEAFLSGGDIAPELDSLS